MAQAADLPDVSVSKGTKNDSASAILQTSLDGLGGIGRFVKPGQTVAIKPNATWAYPPHTASSTDPDLLRALIQMVQDAGAKRIIVMDHCAIDPGTEESLRVSGIGAVVDAMGVEQVFPDRRLAPQETYTQIDLPSGKKYQSIGVIKAAVEADVRINMAVAKSHNVTKLTLSLKHMMGFLEEPQILHSWLYQGIADLNTPSAIQAHLHILEAIRVRVPFQDYVVCAGPETDVTDPRVVKRFNQVVAGVDPALVDAYACINYYAMKPRELAYLNLAAQSGVGQIDVDKATTDGRLQIFTVGQSVPTPLPSATMTEVPGTATPSGVVTLSGSITPATTETVISTSTPLPTAISDTTSGNGPVRATPFAASGDVINPAPIMNVALIPAAVIVSGAGLVALKRMQKRDNTPDNGNGEDDSDQQS